MIERRLEDSEKLNPFKTKSAFKCYVAGELGKKEVCRRKQEEI